MRRSGKKYHELYGESNVHLNTVLLSFLPPFNGVVLSLVDILAHSPQDQVTISGVTQSLGTRVGTRMSRGHVHFVLEFDSIFKDLHRNCITTIIACILIPNIIHSNGHIA